ncbi:hypothetical protein [Actinoallomurus acaciae]|uniref:Luciferase-like monooxygenase n=1 Tax=Actinoallomurus acaciae TaxID=502577 RepID=A0ABV5Y8X5_9ACTN
MALAYFVLGDADRGRANLRDYYLAIGPDHADQIARSAGTHTVALKETIESFAAIGADELILLPGLDDVNEVDRLAEAVL